MSQKKRGYNWTHKKSCKSKNPPKPKKTKPPPKPYSSPKTVDDWIRITYKGQKLALELNRYDIYPCDWWYDYRCILSSLLSTLKRMERNSIPPRDLVERMEKIHEFLLEHNVLNLMLTVCNHVIKT